MDTVNMKLTLSCVVCGLVLASSGEATLGQLYTETFDDLNASTRWMDNTTGMGLDLTVDPAVAKPMDTVADFAFDYSSVGIPSAPNSGGTTIGMKLQANLFSDAFGGFSVSPLTQNFTGDYVLSYDMWQNYNGPLDSGFNGTTNLTYGGIMTSGTVSNFPGTADGVWFAATGDGDSGADYRAYSQDRAVSYQVPGTEPEDDAAVYFADSRNNTADLYRLNINPAPDPVGDPFTGGVTAPAAQLNLYPQQTGAVKAGALGMAWRHHEITKSGDIITWSVDGFDLIQVDASKFVTNQPGGGNILFGYSDTGQGSSTDFNAQFLLFGLIDNVEVSALTAMDDADFDEDGDVDGKDFLAWQRGFGIDDGSAQLADGDATGDGNVDQADLVAWQTQYGVPLTANLAAVPEPMSIVSCAMFGLLWFLGYRPCRQPVLVR